MEAQLINDLVFHFRDIFPQQRQPFMQKEWPRTTSHRRFLQARPVLIPTHRTFLKLFVFLRIAER